MLGTFRSIYRTQFSAPVAALLAASLVLPTASAAGAARGPDNIADVAEKVIDAVVNISTSQNVAKRRNAQVPQLPNDPQLDELFEDFFNRRGQGDPRERRRRGASIRSAPASSSTSGIVVTNNHVIADADEISVILNDGSRLKAEMIGKDHQDRPRASAGKARQAAEGGEVRRFRQAPARRMGGRNRQSVNLGGTVTAGIVSARNRDINSGPYDNYIQTDAAIIAAIPAGRCSTSMAR